MVRVAVVALAVVVVVAVVAVVVVVVVAVVDVGCNVAEANDELRAPAGCDSRDPPLVDR